METFDSSSVIFTLTSSYPVKTRSNFNLTFKRSLCKHIHIVIIIIKIMLPDYCMKDSDVTISHKSVLKWACRFVTFPFSLSGEFFQYKLLPPSTWLKVQSERFPSLSQTEIKNSNLFSSIDTQHYRPAQWNLFEFVSSYICWRQTKTWLWHRPSSTQACIFLDFGPSSGEQATTRISTTLGWNRQNIIKWKLTAV